MARLLKRSTVVKALIQQGWLPSSSSGKEYFYFMNYGSTRAVADVETHGRITISDARWTKRTNVHIVSYWGPFRNIKELSDALIGIGETYKTLCHGFE